PAPLAPEHVLPDEEEDPEEEEPEEEEDLEEDPEEEEPEEEEDPEEEDIDIKANYDIDGPKLIHPYEVVEGALMPPPAEPDTPSDHEPKVKVATVGTIRQVPLTRHMPFSSIH
ncbi:hypothetical protein Tco_0512965, partial [Tanacetum coccineum]